MRCTITLDDMNGNVDHISIRRLWPADGPRVVRHLLRLTPEQRHLRFGLGVSDKALRRYVTGVDWSRAVLVGHVGGREVRGLGEMVRLPDDPDAAELGVSVDQGLEGRGLGTALVARLVVLACNRGIRELRCAFLPENQPISRILRNANAEIEPGAGMRHGVLRLPAASSGSVLEETLGEGVAVWRETLAM